MKSLLAKLKAFEAKYPPRRGPECSGCRLPKEAQEFLVAGRKQGSTFRAMASVLKAEGLRMTAYQISYHLREHGQR